MSQVTNVVISFHILEAEKSRLVDVNSYIREHMGFREPPVGGEKWLEHPTYVGAFNYLDLRGFISHLRKIGWEYPSSVQLFVCEHEDDVYRVILPFDHEWGE